jgi:hypothetical protein
VDPDEFGDRLGRHERTDTHRIQWGATEISFSGEEVGWQVTAEGSPTMRTLPRWSKP